LANDDDKLTHLEGMQESDSSLHDRILSTETKEDLYLSSDTDTEPDYTAGVIKQYKTFVCIILCYYTIASDTATSVQSSTLSTAIIPSANEVNRLTKE